MMRIGSTLTVILLLAGCASVTQTAIPTATPTAQPSVTPSVAPSPTPTSTMPPPTLPATIPPVAADHLLDTVAPGEILFFRPGPGQQWALGISHVEIWAMAADGTDQRLIYNQFPVGRNPRAVLSPDGRYLALNSVPGVVVADLQSGQITPLADASIVGNLGEYTGLVWSPDGAILYFQTGRPDEQERQLVSYLWRALMPPVHPPEQIDLQTYAWREDVNAPDESSVLHIHALYGDRLLVGRWQGGLRPPFLYHLFDSATGGRTDLAADIDTIVDVSPNGQRVLVRLPHRGQTVPVHIGDLLPDGTIANVRQVTPADATQQVFMTARFAPDGKTIIAVRGRAGSDLPEGWGPEGEVVLFHPDGQGGYSMTILDPDPDRIDDRFSWLPGQGIIVESVFKSEMQPELYEIWLLPFDGSPGRKLADGFSPLAVGGR